MDSRHTKSKYESQDEEMSSAILRKNFNVVLEKKEGKTWRSRRQGMNKE